MSEPVKITSVEKTKDPRRVEAGKKLRAISRQAKERKVLGVDRSEFSTLAAVFAAAAVIGAIAIQYRSLSKEPSKEDHTVVQGDPQGETGNSKGSQVTTPKRKLVAPWSRLD